MLRSSAVGKGSGMELVRPGPMAAVFEVPHLLRALSSAAVVPADPPHKPESRPRSLANFFGRIPESGHASRPPCMTMLQRLPGTR